MKTDIIGLLEQRGWLRSRIVAVTAKEEVMLRTKAGGAGGSGRLEGKSKAENQLEEAVVAEMRACLGIAEEIEGINGTGNGNGRSVNGA